VRPDGGAVEERHPKPDALLLRHPEQALPNTEPKPANKGLGRHPPRTLFLRERSPFHPVVVPPEDGPDSPAQVLGRHLRVRTTRLDQGSSAAHCSSVSAIAPSTKPENAAVTRGIQALTGPSGRLVTGNSGGGRPKGSRNKLSSLFVAAIASDFAEHVASALQAVWEADPATYLRIVTAFIPRELVIRCKAMPDLNAMSGDKVRGEVERESRRPYLLEIWQQLER
jgi:hypothetical protein